MAFKEHLSQMVCPFLPCLFISIKYLKLYDYFLVLFSLQPCICLVYRFFSYHVLVCICETFMILIGLIFLQDLCLLVLNVVQNPIEQSLIGKILCMQAVSLAVSQDIGMYIFYFEYTLRLQSKNNLDTGTFCIIIKIKWSVLPVHVYVFFLGI